MRRFAPGELQILLRPLLTDEPQTPRQLAGQLHLDHWIVAHALRTMYERGEIERSMREVPVQGFVGDRLTITQRQRVHYSLKPSSVHRDGDTTESEIHNAR